jgi:hypothetical protein
MISRGKITMALLLLLSGTGAPAWAGHGFWSVGINIGPPVFYRPWYPCCPYYYSPVYVAPPPVIVAPASVVQPVPVATPAYAQAPAAPAPIIARASSAEPMLADTQRHLELLASPSDNVRAESAIQLGRLRAPQAVDPLAATLAGDRCPQVREAAARALGLIGSSRAIPALQRAAQVDGDRDVRHSAEFALEVIQAK